MPTLVFLSNVFFLLLWLRIWNTNEQTFTFNPLISAPMRLPDKVVDFLRPVLFGVGTRGIAAISLLFLLAFRGVILGGVGVDWNIIIGLSIGRAFPVGDWVGCVAFSFACFGIFLARLWGLGLLVAVMTPSPRNDRVSEALRWFTSPLSGLNRLPLAATLLVVNMLLVLHLQHVGLPLTAAIPGSTTIAVKLDWGASIFRALVQLGWLTALSMTDLFLFAHYAMLGAVMTSLLAMIMQNRGMQQLSGEAVRCLLGGFSRHPVRIGMIDLTPLAYFVGMNLMHGICTTLLRVIITQAPWN